MFWTPEDFKSGLCALSDLGKQRPDPVAQPAVAASPPLDTKVALRERIKKDALQAYHELGGVEYLKQNPELLDKVLARVITPDPAPPVQNNLNIGWPAWLTARRLAYQESSEVAPDIVLDDHGAPPALAVPTAVEKPAPVPEVAPAPETPLKPSAAIADAYPEDLTKIVKISDIKPGD